MSSWFSEENGTLGPRDGTNQGVRRMVSGKPSDWSEGWGGSGRPVSCWQVPHQLSSRAPCPQL